MKNESEEDFKKRQEIYGVTKEMIYEAIKKVWNEEKEEALIKGSKYSVTSVDFEEITLNK